MTNLARALSQVSVISLLVSSTGIAQTPEVFATGLQTPSKIISLGSGNLLVAEAGSGANTGRISIVDRAGTVRTLIDALPSGLAAPNNDPDGPNGLLVNGRTLYVALGEGDGFVNGSSPGTLQPNPKGPSSPLFATVLRFHLSDDIESIGAPFSLTLDQQNTLADGQKVKLQNGFAQIANVDLLTAFRPARPDPVSIYRNTHLYGLVSDPASLNGFLLADAGNNAIWRIGKRDETPALVTRFANINNGSAPGPPTSEAVPTSVRVFGDRLLVSLLSGFPFTPGNSRVMLVNPRNGTAIPFITGLSSTIDVVPRRRYAWNSDFLVLEFSTNLSTGAPGRLLLYRNGNQTVLASSLVTPSSMAIDESTGSVFITSLGPGTILKLPLP